MKRVSSHHLEVALELTAHDISLDQILEPQTAPTPNLGLRPSRALIHAQISYILSQLDLSRQSLLDLYCHSGEKAGILARFGAVVDALDPNPQILRVARVKNPGKKSAINYYCNALLPFAKRAQERGLNYPIITCLNALERVDNPMGLIQSCQRLLAPAGDLFLSCSHRNLYNQFIAPRLKAQKAIKGPDFHKFLTTKEILHMCQNAGLTLVSSTGYYTHPLQQKVRFAQLPLEGIILHLRKL